MVTFNGRISMKHTIQFPALKARLMRLIGEGQTENMYGRGFLKGVRNDKFIQN